MSRLVLDNEVGVPPSPPPIFRVRGRRNILWTLKIASPEGKDLPLYVCTLRSVFLGIFTLPGMCSVCFPTTYTCFSYFSRRNWIRSTRAEACQNSHNCRYGGCQTADFYQRSWKMSKCKTLRNI